MSDYGFTDEPSTPSARERSPGTDPAPKGLGPRDRRVTAFFTVLALALVAFGGWSWVTRIHADDVAAYEYLLDQMKELDRNLLPLGRGERSPCGFTVEGWTERTWPESSGVQPEIVEAILLRRGWSREGNDGTAPVYRQVVAGRTVTIRLTTGEGARALVVTGASPANSLACRLS